MDNNKNNNVAIFENHKIPMQRVNESLDVKEGGIKEYVFEGVCAVFEGKNNNSRYYDRTEYLRLIEGLQSEIEQNSLAGSLDHPDGDEDTEKDIFTPKMKDLSHLITKLWYKEETDEVWVRIKILDTEWGKNVKACVDAGMPLYISSRASGFIDKDGRVWLSQIHTYDIVYRPGFKDAKLNPVLESYDGKRSCFSVVSMTKKVNEMEEMEQMETQDPSKLTPEVVLNMLSLDNPLEMSNFVMDVIDLLPELYDYPKFIDYYENKDGEYEPFISVIVNYFMENGRYVDGESGISYENIADFIRAEIEKVCSDYFAEVRKVYFDNFGPVLEKKSSKNDTEKFVPVLESLKKSKRNVIKTIRSVNECTSAKLMVADYCSSDNKFQDKLEVVNAYLEIYPDVDRSVLSDKELVLLASDWSNDPYYTEIDGVRRDVASVKKSLHSLSLERGSDYVALRRVIRDVVREVNQNLDVIVDDIQFLFEEIDSIRQDILTVLSHSKELAKSADNTEAIQSIHSQIDSVSQRLTSAVGSLAKDYSAVVSQVTEMEGDMLAIVESNHKMKKQINRNVNEGKLSKANSIGEKLDNIISQISSSAPSFKVFEEDGSLAVPNRYRKKFHALDEEQKYYIKSVFENKNPRSKAEYFSLWESFDF